MSKPECDLFDGHVGPIPRIFKSPIHVDHRGHFAEVINRQEVPVPESLAQVNHSHSTKGVLRGLHWQRRPHDVSKYVTCIQGAVEDVVVDLRKDSATFGRYKTFTLTGIASSKDRLSLWVPEGFAHGFLTLSETADVVYLQSGVHNAKAERGLRWDDSVVGIQWIPVVTSFVVSDKDKAAPLLSELSDADLFV